MKHANPLTIEELFKIYKYKNSIYKKLGCLRRICLDFSIAYGTIYLGLNLNMRGCTLLRACSPYLCFGKYAGLWWTMRHTTWYITSPSLVYFTFPSASYTFSLKRIGKAFILLLFMCFWHYLFDLFHIICKSSSLTNSVGSTSIEFYINDCLNFTRIRGQNINTIRQIYCQRDSFLLLF